MKWVTTLIVAAAAALLASCASKDRSHLPAVGSVCVKLVGLQDHEAALLSKKISQYLVDYNFQPSTATCDATATYTRFGAAQLETVRPGWIPFTVSRGAYWSQEGLLTYVRNGSPDLDDQQVEVRGQSSAQDLYDAVAWQIVRPVTWLYRPRAAAK